MRLAMTRASSPRLSPFMRWRHLLNCSNPDNISTCDLLERGLLPAISFDQDSDDTVQIDTWQIALRFCATRPCDRLPFPDPAVTASNPFPRRIPRSRSQHRPTCAPSKEVPR